MTGGRLSLRSAADKDATRIAWIPDATGVKVLDKAAPEGWVYVEYAGKQGYCMVQYLRDLESIPDGSVGSITITVNQVKLERMQLAIAAVQTAISTAKDAIADFAASGVNVG